MTIRHFRLENLSCPSCVMHLEAMEDDLPGVRKVDANFKKQLMRVEYDESAQSVEGIIAAVSALGHIAIPVQRDDNTSIGGSHWTSLFHL